jgi:hypothetical protein
MAAFGPMFRLTVPNSRWGWQLFAVARTPHTSDTHRSANRRPSSGLSGGLN